MHHSRRLLRLTVTRQLRRDAKYSQVCVVGCKNQEQACALCSGKAIYVTSFSVFHTETTVSTVGI